jgi:hypothetical protein
VLYKLSRTHKRHTYNYNFFLGHYSPNGLHARRFRDALTIDRRSSPILGLLRDSAYCLESEGSESSMTKELEKEVKHDGKRNR